MRNPRLILLSSLCLASLYTGLAQAASGSSWKAAAVEWQVFRTEAENGTQRCEALWVYDDLVGLSLQNNAHNQFYFLLDLPAGDPFPEFTPNKRYEGWLIKHDKTEMPLSVQAISDTRAILLMDDVIVNEAYLSTAAKVLLNVSGFVMEFPLENTMENLKVYKECRQMDDPAVAEAPASKAMPATATTARQNYTGIEIASEFSEGTKARLGNDADIATLGTSGARAVPSGDINMRPVSSNIEISNEFTKAKPVEPTPAPTLTAPNPVDNVINTLRETPAPQLTPPVQQNEALRSSDYSNESAYLEDVYKQQLGNPKPVKPVQEPVSEMVLQDAEAAPVVAEVSAPPMTETESPELPPSETPEGAALAARASDFRAKNRDDLLKETRYSGDNVTSACAVQESTPSASIDTYKEDAANAPKMKSLIKKLSLLEKEKEELRKKLLSVTEEGYISDIVACEPAGGSESETEISDTIVAQFEANIERLRAENQELLAQIDTENDDTARSREENDALHQQVLELTKRNQELQSEVYGYREQVEELTKFNMETNSADTVDEAEAADEVPAEEEATE